MKPSVTAFLVDLLGDLKVLQARIQTFQKENDMALDPTTRQKLAQVFDTIGTEVTEIKEHIASQNDPTEINQELDTLIGRIQNISEEIKSSGEVPNPENPPV